MPTWVLVLLGAAFLAAVWLLALAFTHTHPIEQEDPWPTNDATSTDAPEK